MTTDDLLSAEEGEIPAGTVIADRYRIERPLGQGGMGAVYLASDRLLGNEKIAIKILHSGYVDNEVQTARFLREVQLMRKVNHKNVVRTYDVGADGEVIYFTMEFVPGTPLERLIGASGVDRPKVLSYAKQIAEALQAIHQAGIIHRDLKPGNILILEDNTLRITDFGVARPEVSNLTTHDEIIGSVCYMAPEIWLGKTLTPSVDLYAFGVILYELTTGNVPFDGDSPAVLMRAHLDRAVIPPKQISSSVPSWLSKLIVRLLGKTPGDRPHDAKEVLNYLKLHDNDLSLEASSSHIALPTASQFFEELENKSQTLQTLSQQPSINTRLSDAGIGSQMHVRVVKRTAGNTTETTRKQVRRSSLIGIQLFSKALYAFFFSAAILLLIVALDYCFRRAFPEFPELLANENLLQPTDFAQHLSIIQVIKYGLPHLFTYLAFLGLPALLLGASSGSHVLALKLYFRSIAFLSLSLFIIMGYFLAGVSGYSHLTGLSILSAFLTAKDQLSTVALLSPVANIYEQNLLGNGLVQSFVNTAPLTKNLLLLCLTMCYLVLSAQGIKKCLKDETGFLGKSHYCVALVLGILLMIETVLFRKSTPAPWDSYLLLLTKIPLPVLWASLLHWLILVGTTLAFTNRPKSKSTIKSRTR